MFLQDNDEILIATALKYHANCVVIGIHVAQHSQYCCFEQKRF